MNLAQRLQTLREKSAEKIPAESAAVIHRAKDELRSSGILDRALGVGAAAPSFSLPNAAREPVELARLSAQGPVVVSFYRGRW